MRALTLIFPLLFSNMLFAEPVDYSLPDLDGKM
ncbi:hypothetical protein MNBD_GAMMA14-1340, partial [hydrothermal vent metagenome]